MEQSIETVMIDMMTTAEGRATINIRAENIQASQEQVWERIIVILQSGLRGAILQTVAPQHEPSRIVQPQGFMVPASGGH